MMTQIPAQGVSNRQMRFQHQFLIVNIIAGNWMSEEFVFSF